MPPLLTFRALAAMSSFQVLKLFSLLIERPAHGLRYLLDHDFVMIARFLEDTGHPTQPEPERLLVHCLQLPACSATPPCVIFPSASACRFVQAPPRERDVQELLIRTASFNVILSLLGDCGNTSSSAKRYPHD